MRSNEYVSFLSQIQAVIRHTDIEYTFRMSYEGAVRPGQFFQVSLPKYGEAPISVSGTGDGTVDLTIRRVGKVTGEIFERYVGDTLFLRGPYGNGFDLEDYRGKELVIVAGGTGLSPVRGVVDHFARHPDQCQGLTLVAGFKTPRDILFQEDLRRWGKTAQVLVTVDCAQGDSACHEGMVTEYLPTLRLHNPAQAVAVVVGPPMMMKFTVQGLLALGLREEGLWVSFERRMCCGIGTCGHCRIGDAYVCLDGPVFPYVRAKQLVD